jgi:hypothetical protein
MISHSDKQMLEDGRKEDLESGINANPGKA